MFKRSLASLIACVALGSGSVAAGGSIDDPAYILDGQYTATLEQSAHRWRLLPLRGDEVDITDRSKDCGSRVPIPNGLWMITQDDNGRPLLVAPSVTALPGGFPQTLALRACGDPAEENVALFVPAVVLDWINTNVGTVLIDD